MDIADLLKKHTEGVELKFGEQKQLIDTIKEQLAQLEQRGAMGGGAAPRIKSLGEQFASDQRYAQFKANNFAGAVKIQLKSVTSASSGQVFSERDPEISQAYRGAISLRDLLTVVPTGSSSVDWTQQTARTNNAAPVAEGAQKPYSDYSWAQLNTPIRTIAHLVKITRQAADDAAQLQGEIDSEMRYGLKLAEETQMLSGDGTGQNLTGLIAVCTAFSKQYSAGAAGNLLDVIGQAILQVQMTGYEATGIVLNPVDYTKLTMLKDTTGQYLARATGNVSAAASAIGAAAIWDMPVALTAAFPVGKFMVGNFKLQRLYDRMAPEVLISSENADDFEKNLLTMRCEERIGLAIRRPEPLVFGTFTTALTAIQT